MDQLNKNDNNSRILALIATFFWSTVATAFKFGLQELTPAAMLFWVILIAWTTLLVINIFNKSFSKKTDRRSLFWAAIGGLLNPFLYYIVLFEAYNALPAQMAQSLNYTWPMVLVVFSSVFLRQPFQVNIIWGMLIAFFGVFLISWGGLNSGLKASLTGIILATSSSLIWASYWVINKKSVLNPHLQIFVNFTIGLILISIYVTVTGDFQIPKRTGLISSFYAALFEMAFTFIIWLKAMQLATSTDKISHYIYISPFLSLVFINLFLKEPILITTFLGLGFIIAGIVFVELVQRKKRNAPKSHRS